jgi:hypothetical protein
VYIRGVLKKRLNFLNSAPTSTESVLRLLSAPSIRFWQQTAICPVSLWTLFVELHPMNWARTQAVSRISDKVTMKEHEGQRVSVIFCCKFGNSFTETFQLRTHITASFPHQISSFHKSTNENLINRAQSTQGHTRVFYDAIFCIRVYIYNTRNLCFLYIFFKVGYIGRLEGQAIILSNFFIYPIKVEFMLHVASNLQHFIGTE